MVRFQVVSGDGTPLMGGGEQAPGILSQQVQKLIGQYGGRLMKYASVLVRRYHLTSDLADDLVQHAWVQFYDTFIRGGRLVDGADEDTAGQAKLFHWLLVTMKHKAVDYYREQRRTVSLEQMGEWITRAHQRVEPPLLTGEHQEEDLPLNREVVDRLLEDPPAWLSKARFQEIIDRHNASLFFMVLRYAPDGQAVSDMMRDVWTRFYVAATEGREVRRIKHLVDQDDYGNPDLFNWLQASVYYVWMNHRRKHWRYAGYREAWANQRYESAQTILLRAELSTMLTKALTSCLNERQRTAVLLFFLQEYSQAQISERLGIPVNTVKSDLLRARRLLRKALEQQDITLADFIA
jgi:RNA polymerase sigma factor (sigma-70 family)